MYICCIYLAIMLLSRHNKCFVIFFVIKSLFLISSTIYIILANISTPRLEHVGTYPEKFDVAIYVQKISLKCKVLRIIVRELRKLVV